MSLGDIRKENPGGHIPVMLSEMLNALSPRAGAIYVDGTFGLGGYSKAILESAACQVVGIDRDPNARQYADVLAQSYPERFQFIPGHFGDMKALLEKIRISKVDGVVLDLGVSSPQLDQAERGFSFMQDGPLDMRMDQVGKTAADVVNTFSEEDIANILWRFGDEGKSRLIARRIVATRGLRPFKTTIQLRDVIHEVLKRNSSKIDPATKTFQALRIFVNDEMGELERGLEASKDLLAPGGRLVVVTFHSTEDKIVKGFMRKYSGYKVEGSRHQAPVLKTPHEICFELIQRKSVSPSIDEIKLNVRSRSARLRWINKVN